MGNWQVGDWLKEFLQVGALAKGTLEIDKWETCEWETSKGEICK